MPLNQSNFTNTSWFLNPPRTKNTVLKNPISAAPTLQETLSRSAIKNTFKKIGMKTPKLQEIKNIILSAPPL